MLTPPISTDQRVLERSPLARGEWIWEGVERPALSAKPSRSTLTTTQASQVFSEPNRRRHKSAAHVPHGIRGQERAPPPISARRPNRSDLTSGEAPRQIRRSAFQLPKTRRPAS